MVAFEKYNHGHAARAISTMVELESYYTGKAARVDYCDRPDERVSH